MSSFELHVTSSHCHRPTAQLPTVYTFVRGVIIRSGFPKILFHETNVPPSAFIERSGLPMQRSEVNVLTAKRTRRLSPCAFCELILKAFLSILLHPSQAQQSEDTDTDTDTEMAAATDTTSPMTRAHGGILAALRALYGPDSDFASMSSTLRTSSRLGTLEPHSYDSPTYSFLDFILVPGRRLADLSKALHLLETRPLGTSMLQVFGDR